MEKLNIKTAIIFNSLIEKLNGSDSIKIDNAPGVFMAAHLEKLYDLPELGTVYSLAHYFELNGDLCNDPDMTFLMIPAIFGKGTANIYIPLTFEMQGSALAR